MTEHPCEHDTCCDSDTTAAWCCWRWLCAEHRGQGHNCPECETKLACCSCEGAGCTTCALEAEARPQVESQGAA